jgi:tetratricopeptide (TPR) repeat protein
VARGTQHLKRRSPANARVAAEPLPKSKRPRHARWEDQLFFSRLRVHAKWMFAALAIVFAFGFVLFGIGSGSTGISDALQNFFQGFSLSGGTSVSSLVKKTQEHPKSAVAWRNLATKYEQENQDTNAVAALTTYTTLRPKDTNALSELAGLDLQRATDWETVYQAQEEQAQALTPTSPFDPKSTSALGKAFASLTNPITSALESNTGTAAEDAYGEVITYLNDRLDAYKKLAKLQPDDANTQYELGQSAQDAESTKTAIKAYTAFLKLAPDDPLASTARKALKQLKSTSSTASG